MLIKDKDLLKNAIDIVKEYLEKDDNQLKMLLAQVSKVKGMEEKLEALGNQLLAQGVISGAAVTTLTGAPTPTTTLQALIFFHMKRVWKLFYSKHDVYILKINLNSLN